MFRVVVVVFLSLTVLCLLARSVGRYMTGQAGTLRRSKANRDLERRGDR
jgi:hypothetical protein